eukprot:m51a1_g4023 putative protein serine threonine (443) ;mRNA; r:590199-593305
MASRPPSGMQSPCGSPTPCMAPMTLCGWFGNVMVLNVSGWGIEGPLPNMTALFRLTQVYMDNNRITGPLPNLSSFVWLSTAPENDAWMVEPKSLMFAENGQIGQQVAVGVPLQQSFVVSNRDIGVLHFQVEVPTSNKFGITVVPKEARLKRGCSMKVEVNLILYCTANINDTFAVVSDCMCRPRIRVASIPATNEYCYTDSDGKTRKRESLCVTFMAVGKLSTRIDLDELAFKEVIGEGSFGTVYRGYWRGNQVAIKHLRGLQVDVGDLSREIDIAEQIRSPNIISYLGAAVVPGRVYMVTEYVANGSLDVVIRKYNMSQRYKVAVATNIACGMQFLHRSSILHRDLKPENVLVVALTIDAAVVCKITDFGASRCISSQRSLNLTKGIGTPIFMAPEILAGTENYHKPADVFSFAILLYELWLEREPYSVDNFPSVFATGTS